jgi:oligopeptide transport system permease protein
MRARLSGLAPRGGMTGFVVRRIIVGIPVLFLTLLVTFVLLRLIPGGPFDNAAVRQPPEWLKIAQETRYGLNRPLFLNLPTDGTAPDYGMELRTRYEKFPNCDKLRQGLTTQQATTADPVVVTQGWYLLHTVEEHYVDQITVGEGGTRRPISCDATRTILYSDLTQSQFFQYINNLLRFDFGQSLGQTTRGTPISELLNRRMPPSALVGIVTTIISFMLGIPLGVLAAVYRNTTIDYTITFLSMLLASIPSFVLGPILLLVLIGQLHLMPGPTPVVWQNPNLLSGEFWGRAILPVLSLGIPGSAGLARLTRASVLQVLQDDYVRTARAKGLRERAVLYVHALRNALIPVATSIGPLLAGILLGSFFIEQIFAIPGLGDSFIVGIGQRDYNLVMAEAVIYSFLLILGNILTDVVYTWLDPRIRFN